MDVQVYTSLVVKFTHEPYLTIHLFLRIGMYSTEVAIIGDFAPSTLFRSGGHGYCFTSD